MHERDTLVNENNFISETADDFVWEYAALINDQIDARAPGYQSDYTAGGATSYKSDYLICPDYIAPVLTFKTKKIIVIHDSLFWDYSKNYSALWRKYFLFQIE